MLATLASVKSRLALLDGTCDTLLTNFIKHASGRFDAECNRQLARAAGVTEEFSAGHTELPFSRYPVESVTRFECKRNETEGWVEQTAVEYLLRAQCLISLPGPLGGKRDLLRVTYTGGYVLPGDIPGPGQTALPDELEQACVEQVAYWFQGKDRLGVITSMETGVAFYQFSQLNLLEHVKAILRKFKRWVV